MAKGNLQKLLNKITSDTEADAKTGSIRRELNQHTHVYSLHYGNLVKEVTSQLQGDNAKRGEAKINLTSDHIDIIKRECLEYFKALKAAMLATPTSYFRTSIIKATPVSFEIQITARTQAGNVFGSFIKKNRKAPLDKLRANLFTKLQIQSPEVTKRIFGTEKDAIYGGGLLQIGHRPGYSVAEYRTSKYLQSLSIKTNNITRKIGDVQALITLNAEVSTSTRLSHLKNTKVTIVYVSEQGQDSNRKQGGGEAAIVNSIRKKLTEALSAKEWANFKTSPSANELILAAIMTRAKKAGAKVTVKKSNTSKTKAKSSKKLILGTKTRSKDSITLSAKAQETSSKDTPKQSWSSLIPLINAKLNNRVAANMRAPGLVNRTGRFAQSARVINVESTPKGFPSFVYDYETDPYNVFDSTLGRSPWNTPQRDPRALVDRSVREIVKEMAIGRFFTRRA